jgi:putative hydrolase of the HAD superfamily
MAKKHYRHVFFDLDHTLWDYEKSAGETLNEIYEEFLIESVTNLSPNQFIDRFRTINASLWDQFNQNLIDSKTLRKLRFKLVFEPFPLVSNQRIEAINETFMAECPKKPNLIEGGMEVLEELSQNYALHIITNGFKKTQHIKMECCGILEIFQSVTTSEHAQSKKPDAKIFLHALEVSKGVVKESIMIGDNINTDIIGARNVGMDQVHFTGEENVHQLKPTHTISRLKELMDIL